MPEIKSQYASTARPDQPATLEEASSQIGQLFAQHAMPDELAEDIRRAYYDLGEGEVLVGCVPLPPPGSCQGHLFPGNSRPISTFAGSRQCSRFSEGAGHRCGPGAQWQRGDSDIEKIVWR